jgi:hypothetical protein
MGATVPIIALALSAESTRQQSVRGQRMERRSSEASREQQRQVNRARRLTRESARRDELIEARDRARQTQRRRAAGAAGRRDTILTGPSGLANGGGAGGKTLLGL